MKIKINGLATERVAKLRLELYQRSAVLRHGFTNSVLSDTARLQLIKHLAGQRVSLFLMGLPLTLLIQNINYLLANYDANTVAKMTSDGECITNIKFVAPENQEDFNK